MRPPSGGLFCPVVSLTENRHDGKINTRKHSLQRRLLPSLVQLNLTLEWLSLGEVFICAYIWNPNLKRALVLHSFECLDIIRSIKVKLRIVLCY